MQEIPTTASNAVSAYPSSNGGAEPARESGGVMPTAADYHYCFGCQRAFLLVEQRDGKCPYPDCGATDDIAWSDAKSQRRTLPDVPELGVRYEL